MFLCSECNKQFTYKKNLYCHQRKKHGHDIPSKKNTGAILCSTCGKNFKNSFSLRRHESKIHNVVSVNNNNRLTRIKCTECDWSKARNYKMLRTHLEEIHQQKLPVLEFHFSSLKDFETWKTSYEAKNIVSYVQDSAPKQLTNNSIKRYYYCHRAHSYKPKGHNKRSIKNMGSHKIGAGCPSTMELIINSSGTYFVKLWPVNLGHCNELGRARLTKEDRTIIAGKLSEGVPLQRVIEDVRNSINIEDEIQRIHLLERKDLHNVKRDFGIQYATKFHENDAVSVDLWVSAMKATSNNPILYYKKQGSSAEGFSDDDFILIFMTEFQQEQLVTYGINKICIDGTHGLNAYDFQLFSVLVVDSFGAGVPVAFCFSNRADTDLFILLFKLLKEKVGNINTNTFMSDDAPAFYNAWLNVMGPVENHLLCTWHVQRNWFQNLSKISNKEKQKLVFKTLKTLHSETDENKMIQSLSQFVADLINDTDTKNFGEYFVKHYSNRVKSWAYCHRKYLGINTNMYLESLHKKIKYTYLEQKKCKRLDKTLNALFELIRDIQFEKIIRVSKNKLSPKLALIRTSHKKSLEINDSFVKYIEENKWSVTSSQNKAIEYSVENVTNSCECNLKCSLCNICIHMFKCSCIDSVIRVNICKHIHKIANSHKSITADDSINMNVIDNEGILSNFGEHMSQASTKKIEILDNEIKQKCELLLGLSTQVTLGQDSKDSLVKCLDKAINILNNEKLNFTLKENVNVKKHVDKQLRMYSTKKKRETKNKIPTISGAERENISQGLMSGSDNIINIHTSFDHSYSQ